MKVTMRQQIGGTRDGADWPKPGGSIDLPDEEATQLVDLDLAVPATDEDAHEATDPGIKSARKAVVRG